MSVRDRREGGEWTRAQAMKNGALYVLARAAIAAFGALPAAWLAGVGRGVGALAYWIFGGARAIAHDNVRRVMPEMPQRERRALVRRSYRVLGGHLGDAVAMLADRERFRPLPFDEASRTLLASARAEGRGVLFASAHLGPWERVAGTLVGAGFPLTTLAREGYDPRFTALYDRLRGSLGVRAIYRGQPGAAVRIVKTLRDGGVLGVPMDLASRVASIEAPFLGHVAKTAKGPATIALRTGAAVVVGTAARGRDGALVLTASRVTTFDLKSDADGVHALTSRINDALSARILALPDAWVWMHARWSPGRPHARE